MNTRLRVGMNNGIRRALSLRVALGAALALLSLSCEPSTVIAVTSGEDGANGSLRAAVNAANAAGQSGVRIEIPSGTYALTRCSADDDNRGGDLDLTSARPVTIVGTGPGVVIRQTCAEIRAACRHFAVCLRRRWRQ